MGRFEEIEHNLIEKYRIELCDGSLCKDDWSRMHAHVKQRRICKYHFKNSIQSLFDLAHEIGHIETTKSYMRRCEEEFYATVWAINLLQDEYHCEIPKKVIEAYQRYVDMERDRGIRRGGKHYPTVRDLNLFKYWKSNNK